MGYYGLSLNSGSLGGNLFLNYVLGGLVEFPAYSLCFLCNKLGRKGPHVFSTIFGGLACLGVVIVDYFLKGWCYSHSTQQWQPIYSYKCVLQSSCFYFYFLGDPNITTYFTVLNTLGKFGVTIPFCILTFWSAELFPTSIRNTMAGMCSAMARVGSIAAPFIIDLVSLSLLNRICFVLK